MGVRISVAVLAACGAFWAAAAQAQSVGPFPPGGEDPARFHYGPGEFTPYGGGPYAGEPSPGSSPAVLFSSAGTAEINPHSGAGYPGAMHGEGCPCPECRRPSLVDRMWGMDAVLANAFRPPLSDTWLRVEYLHWRFENPGDRLLGSPLSTVEHPQLMFPVFDLNEPASLIGVARVPTIDDVNLTDNQGLRLTYGIPLTFGELELSGFMFERADAVGAETMLNQPRLPGQFPFFAATSTFLNGIPFNNVQLWDQSFRYEYKADLWGADARFVWQGGSIGEGLHIKPIVGARVLNLDEQLIQTGVYTGGGALPRPQIGIVDIKTRNYFWGPMIGARVELAHRWFQIGVDPSVTLGLNTYEARVKTLNFVSIFDPELVTKTNQTDFSPVFEAKAWLRVPVTENLSLYGGYSVLYAPKTARPASSVTYDVISATGRSNVHARKNLEEWDAHGFNVGLEYRFP